MNIDIDVIDSMIEIRRHLHRFPELSNQEFKTQATIRAELDASGLADVRPTAGTGLIIDVVGTAGASNRKVAVRADMDALPIREESEEPFSSQNEGIMHACGHDAHTAMVLAAAKTLHRNRHAFRGTVRFIFQPAEEAEPLGGRRVVEEGGIDDVEAVIGIHVDPYLDTGRVAVTAGVSTLASDIFDLTITGMSSHAARPHEGIDAIAIGSAIIGEVQKIVAREVDPTAPLIISVTSFAAGGAYNIIADSASLKGTIRSGTETIRLYAHQRLHDIVNGISAAHRANSSLVVTRGEPCVQNDPQMVSIIEGAAELAGGPNTTISASPWTTADDFGFYAEKRPSVYFRLGVRNPHHASFPLHHPKFTIDESAMVLGLKTLVFASTIYLDGDYPEIR
jgi:amidohydrolase